MRSIFICIFLVAIFIISCETPIEPDKQIRLEFGKKIGTSSTDWELLPDESAQLIKFNKNNYPGADSITFAASMYNEEPHSKCFVQLYNVTDSIAIGNTTLESYEDYYVIKETGNIFDYLPDKEINLAIRIKSNSVDNYVAIGDRSYIFIYRE